MDEWMDGVYKRCCLQNETRLRGSKVVFLLWVKCVRFSSHLPFVSLLPEYNISAAAISIFSLIFSILGSLCLVGSCTGKGKGRHYLLKPAGMFFAFAGEFRFFGVSGAASSRLCLTPPLSPLQASAPSSLWK